MLFELKLVCNKTDAVGIPSRPDAVGVSLFAFVLAAELFLYE